MQNCCDCIIPFYNEELRPIEVVESILKVKLIKKVIVVDDGSTDNRAYLTLKTKFPQINLVRLEKNYGKACAIKEGFKYVTSDYILLMDGDLTNIKENELKNAISKITQKPEIDMIILRRVEDKTVVVSRLLRHDIIFSGQRILRTNDLKKIFVNPIKGYKIESAINSYMIKNHKKVYWMPLSIHNLFKHHKWGLTKGFLRVAIPSFIEIMISSDIIYQTLFYCRKEVS